MDTAMKTFITISFVMGAVAGLLWMLLTGPNLQCMTGIVAGATFIFVLFVLSVATSGDVLPRE